MSSFIRHKFIWKFASLEALNRAATLIDVVVLVDFHIVPNNKRLLKSQCNLPYVGGWGEFFRGRRRLKTPHKLIRVTSLRLIAHFNPV
jgi:hypothetical protein